MLCSSISENQKMNEIKYNTIRKTVLGKDLIQNLMQKLKCKSGTTNSKTLFHEITPRYFMTSGHPVMHVRYLSKRVKERYSANQHLENYVIYLFIYLQIFTQDCLFSTNQTVINESPAFFAKHLQRKPMTISSERSSSQWPVETNRLRIKYLNHSATAPHYLSNLSNLSNVIYQTYDNIKNNKREWKQNDLVTYLNRSRVMLFIRKIRRI